MPLIKDFCQTESTIYKINPPDFTPDSRQKARDLCIDPPVAVKNCATATSTLTLTMTLTSTCGVFSVFFSVSQNKLFVFPKIFQLHFSD